MAKFGKPTKNDPGKEADELTDLEMDDLRIEFESDVIGNMETHFSALADQIDLFTAEIANNKSITVDRLLFIAAYIQSARDLAFSAFVNDKKQSVIEARGKELFTGTFAALKSLTIREAA